MYEPRTDDHLYVRSRPLSELSRHRRKQIDVLKGQETEIVVSRLVRNCEEFWSLRRSSMGTTAERAVADGCWGRRRGQTGGTRRPHSVFCPIDYTVRQPPVARSGHVCCGAADRACAVNALLGTSRCALAEPHRKQTCSVLANTYFGYHLCK